MEFPVPAYTSFTIPTGATTGARITFNEFGDGLIRVYNSAGTLVNSIGGQFGSVISYGQGLVSDIALQNGRLLFGFNSSNFSPAASVTCPKTNLGALDMNTGTGTAGLRPDGTDLFLLGGNNNVVTGNANVPFASLSDTANNSMADFRLTGAVIKQDFTNTPYTWQAPGYAANWSAGAVISGLGGNGLQYRFMGEDDVWLLGLATAAAGAGTTIFTLPAAYTPVNTPHGQVLRDRGGVIAIVEVAVFLGQIIVGQPVVAGDVYSFNFRVPLGNYA